MAKAAYKYPIEFISGKVKKSHDIAFCHRKHINGDGEQKNFTMVSGYDPDRTISAGEAQARTRFAAVRAMVRARMVDMSVHDSDMAAFKAQSKYKTFNKYLWHICGEEYDAQQG